MAGQPRYRHRFDHISKELRLRIRNSFDDEVEAGEILVVIEEA